MTDADRDAALADCERAKKVAHDFWCTPVEETVGVLLRLAAHCEAALAENAEMAELVSTLKRETVRQVLEVKAENARLRELLRPAAEKAEYFSPDWPDGEVIWVPMRIAACRAAADALKGTT